MYLCNLQKYTFPNYLLFSLIPFFKFHRLAIEGAHRHAAGFRRLLQRQLLRPPRPMYLIKILRQGQRRTAKLHAPGLGRRNALRLPLFDALPLALGHKGQNLQNQIGDEGVHQVPALPGVQHQQIKNATGYDHNYCLNTYKDGTGDDTQVCASLYSPKSGIFMEMFTNEPGVQVYSGNFQGVGADAKIARKHGLTYPKHVSICLESQKYPDSPNKKDWVQPTLKPGEKYHSHAAYRFSIK